MVAFNNEDVVARDDGAQLSAVEIDHSAEVSLCGSLNLPNCFGDKSVLYRRQRRRFAPRAIYLPLKSPADIVQQGLLLNYIRH